jgi:hypothetical protein
MPNPPNLGSQTDVLATPNNYTVKYPFRRSLLLPNSEQMEAADSSKTYALIYGSTWNFLPSTTHQILSSAQCTLFKI